MTTRAFVTYLISVGVLAAPAISAQQKTPELDNPRFGNPTSIARNLQGDIYGVVKKMSDSEIVLDKTKFGVDTSIRLDSKTKYVRDGKASTVDALKTGDQVYVSVKTEKKTGVMTAKRVLSGVIGKL